jgi:SAM-dependent methyltransferase
MACNEFCGAVVGQVHAILDPLSRERKARNIATLVELKGASDFRRVLDVGTGSKYIAAYFFRLKGGETHAIGVTDERQATDGFQFQFVQGTSLPSDEPFELGISNPAIEHVGNAKDKAHHLKELLRCLEPGGTLYCGA